VEIFAEISLVVFFLGKEKGKGEEKKKSKESLLFI